MTAGNGRPTGMRAIAPAFRSSLRARPVRAATCRVLVAALALALGSALAPPGRAAETPKKDEKDCAAEVAARVQRRYEGVHDLSARFEQTTQRATLGDGAAGSLTSRGHVVFAKPGRMRWSYEEPEPSLVVSDGETLWIYDPRAAEVQKLPLGAGYLSGAGLQFLLGSGRLTDEFQVSAQECGRKVVVLVLTPRSDAQYEHLELRVDRATGAVQETTAVDLFGNRTTVAFSDVRENAKPKASFFHFEPPAGTRVITLPASP
jgi:outer membrane lipoprotein carrier protein